MDLSFESRYARVSFDEGSNAIITVWKEQVTNDAYKRTFLEILNAIKKYGATSLISDISVQGKVPITSRLWMQENILPEAINYGIMQIATVVSQTDYERYSYDGNTQHILIGNRQVEFKYFRETDEAFQWAALQELV